MFPTGVMGQDDLSKAMRSVLSVLPEWPTGQRNNDEPEGSGIIVSDGRNGIVVLTAWHVVSKAKSIRVRTSDGDILRARLLGKDAATDLAVLKLEGDVSALPPLSTDHPAPSRLTET